MSQGIAEFYTLRVLMGILSVTFIFFAVISVILLYHWKRYEPVNKRIFLAIMFYFGGSAFFIGGAAWILFLLVL